MEQIGADFFLNFLIDYADFNAGLREKESILEGVVNLVEGIDDISRDFLVQHLSSSLDRTRIPK
jgi:hypothetical protein